jgi:ATP-dependent Lon protease
MRADPEKHHLEQENLDISPAGPDNAEKSHSELVRAGDVLPGVLHLLPLANRPFFPGQVIPLVVDRDPWVETVQAAMEQPHQIVGLCLVRSDSPASATPEDFHAMGTACRVHRVVEHEDKLQVFVEGLQRFRIVDWVSRKCPFTVRARYYPETEYGSVPDVKAYAVALINTIKELLPLNPLYGEELKFFLSRFGPNEPSHLADFAASLTTSSKEELQDVLETTHILKRLEKVLLLLKKEVEVAETQMQINEQVEQAMEKRQREFLLREQLKAIQKELGIAKDDREAEIERFRKRLAALTLPEEAAKRVDDEMQKLSLLEIGSPEFTVTRNYLDWLTMLPWGVYSKDNLDLKYARGVLDRDHEGLRDVKDRIIEFLGVGAMKGEVAGSILLLVGPPGVGKTSIGRSIAEALGRKYYRFSLGGMRDEAEIKGHRRTYIGAMPGKFVHAIKEAGTSNPVIMLDEVDKIGASFHGDPASALLEVLDPEQNADFLDHYLDVRYDLSKTLFICTANQLDTIPAALLDRMETIRLSGYVMREKVAIARRHLLPRQLERVGLRRGQLRVNDAALRRIVEGYAREAGVRSLDKRLAVIARKAVLKILDDPGARVSVMAGNLEEFLGKPPFEAEQPLRGVGVVTGLAWTPLGGATLDVEATRVYEAARGFKLTGQLGSVMKESAEIAYSCIAGNAARFGARGSYFDKAYIHLHVPAGATPKDGPSAGITMASSLLSLALGRRVRRRLAMTGELTLTGRVLPVGGVREKVIAARRVGIRELIFPAQNRRDFEELPEHIREGITAHYVERFAQVAALLFGEPD